MNEVSGKLGYNKTSVISSEDPISVGNDVEQPQKKC